MIKVGLIGLGSMAATHIRAYRKIPGVEVTAICNPSGRRLNGDLSDVGGNVGTQEPVRLDMKRVKPFRDFSEMLASDIDLVDICTPTPTHVEFSVAALAAGKHVICEKPMARTSREALAIVDAAAAAKGFFMPAMCMRFWPGWTWLKEAIDGSAFGRVLDARFRRLAQPPGWGQKFFLDGAQSGGALLDLHIHDSDFVQYCFGLPRKVMSHGYSRISGAIDCVTTRYDVGGALVTAEGSWCMAEGFAFHMGYIVNFENATADFDTARGAEALRLCEKGKGPRTIAIPEESGHYGELAYFVDCIREGKSPSVVTALDGLSALEICEAEEASVLSGEPAPV